MSTSSHNRDSAQEFPMLHAVSQETYAAIKSALGLCNGELGYDGDRLVLPQLVSGVKPHDYERFLDALGDLRLRHAYDGDSLEMSPRKDHDQVSRFLFKLITAIEIERKMIIQSIGATTLTKMGMKGGLEPDEAFYVANEPPVRFKKLYEPNVDPPPDLVIEIDVTRDSTRRLMLFADLGIPEVWRHVRDELIIYGLHEGHYETISQSLSFPFLGCKTLNHFLNMRNEKADSIVLLEFCDWLRQQPRAD